MHLEHLKVNGLEALALSEHDLQVVVVPDLGAKLCSLRWHGQELLAQNPRKALKAARYAAPYAEFDASGFDECLPSIGRCRYPEYPWQNVQVPDHGEVWSIPWSWEMQAEVLHLWCGGVRFPYDFHKWLVVPAPGSLRLSYALVNRAPFPFKFIWSAHPLFALRPGMRIYLPSGVRVRVDWSKDERLGISLHEHAWPHTTDSHGQEVDLSLILPPEAKRVDKLYTTRLSEGWCAVHDPETGRYAAFLFSTDTTPYVGLSINLGGWPVDEAGYYNLGLEPCNGYPDRLDLAIERGDYAVALLGQSLKWSVDLRVGECADMAAEVGRLRTAWQPAFVSISENL
jgi:galactose mutarotase-like enzyme